MRRPRGLRAADVRGRGRADHTVRSAREAGRQKSQGAQRKGPRLHAAPSTCRGCGYSGALGQFTWEGSSHRAQAPGVSR